MGTRFLQGSSKEGELGFLWDFRIAVTQADNDSRGKGTSFFSASMSEKGIQWGIDEVAANPNAFFVQIMEADGEVYEEVKSVRAVVTRNNDFSMVEMPLPFEILINTEDGAGELKDFLEKRRLMKGMLHSNTTIHRNAE